MYNILESMGGARVGALSRKELGRVSLDVTGHEPPSRYAYKCASPDEGWCKTSPAGSHKLKF